MKLKLKFNAMQILMAELKPNEMWAFYIMAMGEKMPEQVTKAHLTKIIAVLCRKLCWIKDDEPIKHSNITVFEFINTVSRLETQAKS